MTLNKGSHAKFVGALFVFFVPLSQRSVEGAVIEGTGCPTNSRMLDEAESESRVTLFDFCPSLADISKDGTGKYPFYSGQWYEKSKPPLFYYTQVGSYLAIESGGELSTERFDSAAGALPALSFRRPFYLEVTERLSDNDPANWPAIWMMPMEHNLAKSDHVTSDAERYERWLELDIDEGGIGVGAHGAGISWSGIWPHYERSQVSGISNQFLDRTKWHTFGFSFDPTNSLGKWSIDGKVWYTALMPVVSIAQGYHYYLIIGAQTWSQEKPYTLYVGRVRAYYYH